MTQRNCPNCFRAWEYGFDMGETKAEGGYLKFRCPHCKHPINWRFVVVGDPHVPPAERPAPVAVSVRTPGR